MIEIEKPKLECVELAENYGKFVVEPLERGFGTTLGNSMRRILLSSLPGVAVTSVQIDGVLHEFTTIEGVKEDVTEIILNLKELCCKLHCDGPKKVVIDAQGECEVTAADILPDSDVEIINPELHIATLDENGKLHMEMILEHGRGYVTVERNKRPDMPIGQIAVDSIFTPITKVNFTVDNTPDHRLRQAHAGDMDGRQHQAGRSGFSGGEDFDRAPDAVHQSDGSCAGR